MAKIGNSSAFSRSQQPSVVSPPPGRARFGERPAEVPLPRQPAGLGVASSQQSCPAPRGRFSQSRSRERQQPFAAQCKQVSKSPPFCTALIWGPPKSRPVCFAIQDPCHRRANRNPGGGGGYLKSRQLQLAHIISNPRPMEADTTTFTQNLCNGKGQHEGQWSFARGGRSDIPHREKPWGAVYVAKPHAACPRRPGAPRPTRFGAKN